MYKYPTNAYLAIRDKKIVPDNTCTQSHNVIILDY